VKAPYRIDFELSLVEGEEEESFGLSQVDRRKHIRSQRSIGETQKNSKVKNSQVNRENIEEIGCQQVKVEGTKSQKQT